MNKAHRSSLLILILTILITPLTLRAQEVPELQINSQRYVVIDADTGHIYAQRGANDEVAIASLTKVFTAVQALNMAPLDTLVTTNQSDMQPANATTMGFGPGESYTLRDLLYGMMLPSGNDAAYAIARHLGHREGDSDEEAVQRFMDLMNQRISEMGLENTHLMNPDGWGVPGHYSSAADVAAFMQYASEYPFLIEVMGTPSYTTSNGALTVTNTNKILNSYSPLVGGKTGYDWDSGWCLVNLAESGGSRMIAVTLDGIAPDDWYDDNMVLLEYGFEQKSRLASSNNQFDGESVTWNYPDAVELANVGELRTSVSGEISRVDSAPERVGSGESGIPGRGSPPTATFDVASAGPWLANLSAVTLVGLSGALRWKKTGGNFSFSLPQRPILRRPTLDTDDPET